MERKIEYIIVRFFDSDTPVEAIPYYDKDEAVRCWELAQLNWSECFLCKVLDGHSEYSELIKRLTTTAKTPVEERITPYWECEHCTTINGLDKNKCLGCGKERAP